MISIDKYTNLLIKQLYTDHHMQLEYHASFFNHVLPVIDNHPQSRFGLQNHLKLLIGKLPTRIKRKIFSKIQFTKYKFPVIKSKKAFRCFQLPL